MRRLPWLLLNLLLLAVSPPAQPAAHAAGPEIPPGFRLVLSQTGVQLYREDYPGGSPDYVQVIDLGQGAAVIPLHGEITELRQGKGMFGGDDARFRSRSLYNYWRDLSAAYPSATCVTNGQFFYMREYPTRLPFSLKVDGQIVTDGYGVKDHPGQQLMLELWPGHADIVDLNKEALYASSAPDIIAGLLPDANKKPKNYTGRTFVGLLDANGDGLYETVMIFNTLSARQVDAAEVLKSFGAEKLMMLDGGGSTQLICDGKSYVPSERLIPQALGILAGPDGVTAITGQDLAPSAVTQNALPADQIDLSSAAQFKQAAAFASQETPETAQPTPQAQSQPEIQNPAAPPNRAQPDQDTRDPAQVQAPAAPASSKASPPAAGSQVQIQAEETAAPVQQAVGNAPEPVLAQPQARAPSGAPESTKSQTLDAALVRPTAQQASKTLALAGSPAQNAQSTGAQAAAHDLPQASAQGQSTIRINDVIWVPVGMSPVVLLLLFVFSKNRNMRG